MRKSFKKRTCINPKPGTQELRKKPSFFGFLAMGGFIVSTGPAVRRCPPQAHWHRLDDEDEVPLLVCKSHADVKGM